MSRKYLRELYNQSHTKCRACERAKANGVSDGGVERPKVKTLFHPRPWLSHTQNVRQINQTKWDPQEFPNMAEELQKLARTQSRYDKACRKSRRARETVRRLFTKFEAQTIKIEDRFHRGVEQSTWKL